MAYELVLVINQVVVKFPRNQRPGLGRRMEEAAFGLLDAMVKARYQGGGDKRVTLIQAAQSLDSLRLLVRMSKDLTYLPVKRYEDLARKMLEIGRMVGGWQKKAGG